MPCLLASKHQPRSPVNRRHESSRSSAKLPPVHATADRNAAAAAPANGPAAGNHYSSCCKIQIHLPRSASPALLQNSCTCPAGLQQSPPPILPPRWPSAPAPRWHLLNCRAAAAPAAATRAARPPVLAGHSQCRNIRARQQMEKLQCCGSACSQLAHLRQWVQQVQRQ